MFREKEVELYQLTLDQKYRIFNIDSTDDKEPTELLGILNANYNELVHRFNKTKVVGIKFPLLTRNSNMFTMTEEDMPKPVEYNVFTLTLENLDIIFRGLSFNILEKYLNEAQHNKKMITSFHNTKGFI